MNYLSVIAIIRNEAKYLPEWLEFHRLQGVDHFYLFDNMSDDGVGDVLDEVGDVTCIPWDVIPPAQGAAYNYAIEHFRNESHWAAFIDGDEFLYSPTNKPVAEILHEKYERAGISGVAVRWFLYGSNGHERYNNKPVLERFTKRGATVNQHCKSIMRLSETISMGNDPHSFRAMNDIVNENYKVMPEEYALVPNEPAEILRISHYVTKSKLEYQERKKLPDANSGIYKDFNIMWNSHNVNDVTDLSTIQNRDILKKVY